MIFAVAVFAPLVGSLISGLFGRQLGDRGAQAVSVIAMLIAAVCGVAAGLRLLTFLVPDGLVPVVDWLHVGDFQADWALRYDSLSAVMVMMVTVVSTLIHIYSIGYMEGDRSVPRFFAYLSLFTFSMLMLVTANDLLQLFFGWEGVGLVSYLLIGFWYDKPSANDAAIKAFVMNRIGDLGFALGIALIFFLFGSIRFDVIFAAVPAQSHAAYHLFGTNLNAMDVIGILLFIGAMGKSAQLGLHPWLADAMEGPTPVSALIHAATMVTAGVFLVVRMSPLLEYAPVALAVIGIIGGTTAVFAATIGCAQTDIKRVIAYSTCSQLGYMFVAASVGAYQASMFHLIMHAFFKALLFLTAGSVIHAMSGEQDMRKMGGLARLIPFTYAMMWIGSLALAGIPPLSGFFSKDAIISAALLGRGGGYACICVEVATFLTAFYTWRLIFMTFHGPRKGEAHVMAHVHESPWVMLGAARAARGRRGIRRHPAGPHFCRGWAKSFLERVHRRHQSSQHPARSRACAASLGPAAERARPARDRDGLCDVYRPSRVAGDPGDPLRLHLPAAAQQVVCGRTLWRDLRAALPGAGPRDLACRR